MSTVRDLPSSVWTGMEKPVRACPKEMVQSRTKSSPSRLNCVCGFSSITNTISAGILLGASSPSSKESTHSQQRKAGATYVFKSDFCALLPARLNVNGQNLCYLHSLSASVTNVFGNFHLLGAATVQLIQRERELPSHWRIFCGTYMCSALCDSLGVAVHRSTHAWTHTAISCCVF